MTSATVVDLCFHGIGTPQRQLEAGEDKYWITPRFYEEILDEVAGRPDVQISFDDGNKSDVDVALGGLLRRGMSATFFVLAGRLDSPGSLDEDDVRALCARGMTIGTHGMDHRTWRGMDPETSRRELVEARQRLVEVTGERVEQAALPLGQYDRTVLNALRGYGYRTVHTSDRRLARPGSWIQPRYSVRHTDTIESIRDTVLTRPALLRRFKAEAVGAVKRLR